jgi:hypothetical protein
VLSELVIDQERGLTALDLLSTTYKKAGELAAKSSKVALSLLLVITAFLGFNSLTGREGVISGVVAPAPSSDAPVAAPAESASPTPSLSFPAKKSSTMISGVYIKGAKALWPGLDADGNPTGFTVAGSNGPIGKVRVNRNTPTSTDEGTVLATQVITAAGGPNVMFDQSLTVNGSGTSYAASYVAFGINGSWVVADDNATSVDFERTSNGQYIATVTISLVSTPTSEFVIPVGDRGYDLTSAPKTITSRLLLNASKTQILAQAVFVPGA